MEIKHINKIQAIIFKNLGFNEPVNYFYIKGDSNIRYACNYHNFNASEEFISAPSLYEIQQWLMKHKHINIIPHYIKDMFYTCKVYYYTKDNNMHVINVEHAPYRYDFRTYNEALLAGIEVTIKLINILPD